MTPTDHSRAGHGHGHDDHLYDESTLHNEDVAHEHSDVNVRALLTFMFGLVAVVVVIYAAMLGVFKLLATQAAANDPVMSPLARPAGQQPPEPRLLTDEPLNLQRFRAQQTDALKGIDDAKKRLLEQGLPVRADAPNADWMGTHAPAHGESSGGRAIPIRPGADAPAQPVQQPAAAEGPAGHAPQPAAPKSGGH